MGRGRWGWEPGDRDWGGFPAHADAAERKRRSQAALKGLAKKLGREPVPVPPSEGRVLATTFWGKAWCTNLERYGDYETRLPRGRSYVREGAVVDLWIQAGRIDARVAGTELYEVQVKILPVAPGVWKEIRRAASGKIDSVVEMLAGKLPDDVMRRVTEPEGLFPSPREISFLCSCPDAARMCKHIAAVLYGIGMRFDVKPELLFTLRGADPQELVAAESVDWLTLRPPSKRVLADAALAGVFGVDLVREDGPRYGRTRPAKKNKRSTPKSRVRKTRKCRRRRR